MIMKRVINNQLLMGMLLAAILLCATGISYFMTLLPTHLEWARFSPVVIVMAALPIYFLLTQIAGWSTALVTIIFLSIFGLAFEAFSVATGWPYGFFRYNAFLGEKIMGLVPWTVAFAWPPLVILSVMTSRLITRRWLSIFISTGLLLWFDLFLDPGAVKLGFWYWLEPGPYFGVPWINFLGWLISGLVSSIVVTLILYSTHFTKRMSVMILLSFFANTGLWTILAFWQQHWIPAALGSLLGGWLIIQLHSALAVAPVQPKSNKLALQYRVRYSRPHKKDS